MGVVQSSAEKIVKSVVLGAVGRLSMLVAAPVLTIIFTVVYNSVVEVRTALALRVTTLEAGIAEVNKATASLQANFLMTNSNNDILKDARLKFQADTTESLKDLNHTIQNKFESIDSKQSEILQRLAALEALQRQQQRTP